jgi:hypothetical protein
VTSFEAVAALTERIAYVDPHSGLRSEIWALLRGYTAVFRGHDGLSAGARVLDKLLSHRLEITGVQYLRGFAAMSVVVFHLSFQLFWLRPTLQPLTTLQSGVDLFFVISGYIMFYSTSGGCDLSPVEFIKRRLVRIVPLIGRPRSP